MALKVVQWATGGLGVAAIRGIAEHPDLELAGCWVHSAAKAGRDAGEIAGIGKLGVTATNSIDDILALDADAVIYAPLAADPDEVAALLRSGKNVITPVGWVYPSERTAALGGPGKPGDTTTSLAIPALAEATATMAVPSPEATASPPAPSVPAAASTTAPSGPCRSG